MALADRFWAKVDRRGPDECWPWTAATNEHGYGVLHPEGQRHGPTVKAHRVSITPPAAEFLLGAVTSALDGAA